MGYSVKWVEDNLGITRKALRYYEDKGLMPKNSSRNPKTNYRDYSEDDINKIWGIKTLQGIGFTVNEIKDMMVEDYPDFYGAISKKINELEAKRTETDKYIQLAETIKLTGIIPEVKKIGSIRFEDFINYLRDNWNFHEEYKIIQDANYLEMLVDSDGFDNDYISRETADKLLNVMNIFIEKFKNLKLDTYFEILANFSTFDYRCDAVQTLIKLLHEFFIEGSEVKVEKGDDTRDIFARVMVPGFIPGGDVYTTYEKRYGAQGCRFIAKSIAYYGGYDRIDEVGDENNEQT